MVFDLGLIILFKKIVKYLVLVDHSFRSFFDRPCPVISDIQCVWERVRLDSLPDSIPLWLEPGQRNPTRVCVVTVTVQISRGFYPVSLDRWITVLNWRLQESDWNLWIFDLHLCGVYSYINSTIRAPSPAKPKQKNKLLVSSFFTHAQI